MRTRALLITLLVLALSLMVVTPVAAASPTYEPTWHWVVRGETLFSIGRLYNVSPWAIASANRLANPNRIYVGQRLCIPARVNHIYNMNYIWAGQRLFIPCH
jgi:LysM repeat protein